MNAHTTTNETRFKTLCNSPVLYMRIVILCIFSNCTNCMHLFVSDNTQIIYTVNGQMSGYAKKAIFSCHKQKKLTSQYTCTYSMQNKTTLYPMYVCIGTHTHTLQASVSQQHHMELKLDHKSIIKSISNNRKQLLK